MIHYGGFLFTMAQITDIKPQKRKKGRVNIFLDDRYAFSLADMTAAYLKIGQELTDEKIDELRHEDEYERAKDGALRLIIQRPRSVQEVRQRLLKKEFAPETIDSVCQRLVEIDMLDDAAFARYWVEQRERFKPRSPLALRQELAQKGIARDIIDEVVSDVDPEEAARTAAHQKVSRWQSLTRDEFFKKCSGFLQRRGFSYGITYKITEELWEHSRSSLEGD